MEAGPHDNLSLAGVTISWEFGEAKVLYSSTCVRVDGDDVVGCRVAVTEGGVYFLPITDTAVEKRVDCSSIYDSVQLTDAPGWLCLVTMEGDDLLFVGPGALPALILSLELTPNDGTIAAHTTAPVQSLLDAVLPICEAAEETGVDGVKEAEEAEETVQEAAGGEVGEEGAVVSSDAEGAVLETPAEEVREAVEPPVESPVEPPVVPEVPEVSEAPLPVEEVSAEVEVRTEPTELSPVEPPVAEEQPVGVETAPEVLATEVSDVPAPEVVEEVPEGPSETPAEVAVSTEVPAAEAPGTPDPATDTPTPDVLEAVDIPAIVEPTASDVPAQPAPTPPSAPEVVREDDPPTAQTSSQPASVGTPTEGAAEIPPGSPTDSAVDAPGDGTPAGEGDGDSTPADADGGAGAGDGTPALAPPSTAPSEHPSEPQPHEEIPHETASDVPQQTPQSAPSSPPAAPAQTPSAAQTTVVQYQEQAWRGDVVVEEVQARCSMTTLQLGEWHALTRAPGQEGHAEFQRLERELRVVRAEHQMSFPQGRVQAERDCLVNFETAAREALLRLEAQDAASTALRHVEAVTLTGLSEINSAIRQGALTATQEATRIVQPIATAHLTTEAAVVLSLRSAAQYFHTTPATEAPPFSTSTPTCGGYLLKANVTFSAWYKKYCVLSNGRVTLFSAEGEANGRVLFTTASIRKVELDTYNCPGSAVTRPPLGNIANVLGFFVQTWDAVVFRFCAFNKEDRKRWMTALRSCIEVDADSPGRSSYRGQARHLATSIPVKQLAPFTQWVQTAATSPSPQRDRTSPASRKSGSPSPKPPPELGSPAFR